MPQLPAGIPLDVLQELIKASESGNFGGYNALAWHRNYNPNAMARPLDQYGFPIWQGSSATGQGSHGAGAYQMEPKLWREFAPGLGVTDFSPASQDQVAQAALNRYGIDPWKTNARLQQAIQAYQTTGMMPVNQVTAPQPVPPPTLPGLQEAGAPQPFQEAGAPPMQQLAYQPYNLGFGSPWGSYG